MWSETFGHSVNREMFCKYQLTFRISQVDRPTIENGRECAHMWRERKSPRGWSFHLPNPSNFYTDWINRSNPHKVFSNVLWGVWHHLSSRSNPKKMFFKQKEIRGASKRNKHRRVSVLNLDIRKGTLLATYKSYEHTLVHTTLQV